VLKFHLPTLRAIHQSIAAHAALLQVVWAAIVALSLLVIGPTHGQAQVGTALVERLEVALWPEYDQPAMLVIYRFELAPDTMLPARVDLPIPIGAGQPNAVAFLGDDGVLYDAEFNLEPAGDWSVVQVEMSDARTGQMEYYSAIDFSGTIRSFLFEWPSGFELGGMAYEVQVPVAATELIVNPAPDLEGPGDFGLNYLTAELGPRASDSATVISVTYKKVADLLSIDAFQPLGQTPVDDQTGNLELLPWLVYAAGIAVLGGGAYYLALQRRSAPRFATGRRKSAGTGIEMEASTVYCHQCGAAAGIMDVFCRQCGTKLRR